MNHWVRQVLQGGGNMPAYGKNLSPAEVTALVSFLETCIPRANFPRTMLRNNTSAPGNSTPGNRNGCRFSSSFHITNSWVPHISLGFCEMWDTTAFNPKAFGSLSTLKV